MRKLLFAIITVVSVIAMIFIYLMITPSTVEKLEENYRVPAPLISFEKEYDVIVIGGEPEGVAAAVAAARNGAKTLLIEERDGLGGLFTYGMLNFLDLPKGIDRKMATAGIFKEWHELVGGGNAFRIKAGKAAFLHLVEQEENLTLSAQTEVLTPIVRDQRIEGVKLRNPHLEQAVFAKRFIDATQDASFAAEAGAPYFIGGEDIGRKDKKMAVTLMIHLQGVDWNKVKSTAKSGEFGTAEVHGDVTWGFTELHYMYEPVEENTRLRGLNLAKLGDNYYINALQLFGVDGLDEQSKQKAIEKGKRETKHILQYLKANFPGFENAEIASFPSELYVRETRHIISEYQVTMSDIWANRDHWDSIGYGGYPVDVQAQTANDYGYVIANPVQYAIPFRSLVPKEIDNILVTGRSAGYSSIAAASTRIVPTGMGTGQAAGTAAALSIQDGVSFREMILNKDVIAALRERLKNDGALVDHFEIAHPYEGKWYYPAIKVLLSEGLVVGGYDNDLYVDEPMSKHTFVGKLQELLRRVNKQLYEEKIQEIEDLSAYIYNEENEPLTRDKMVSILNDVFVEGSLGDTKDGQDDLFVAESSVDEEGQDDVGADDGSKSELIDQAWNELQEKGIIDDKTRELLPENQEVENKVAYHVLATILEQIDRQ
jgi:hypothetical protein